MLLTISLLLSAGCEQRRQSSSPFAIVPERGSFSIIIQGRGHLEPQEEKITVVPPKLYGSLEYLVDEGSSVEQGSPLFRISTERLERSARRFWIKAGKQRVEYEKAKVKNEQASAKRSEELSAAALQLCFARDKEDFLTQAADPLEIEKARLELASATHSIEYLNTRLETRRTLAKKGYASELELLQTEDAYEQSALKKELAYTELERLRQGKSKDEKRKLRLDTKRLSISYEELSDKNTREEKVDQLSLERQRLNMESSKEAAQQRDRILEGAQVTAPCSGTAIYMRRMRGSGFRKGMTVRRGMRLVKVAQLDELQGVIQVAAGDIEEVELGARAELSFPALPDLRLPGKVVRIGKIAVSNRWSGKNNAKHFEVRVELLEGSEKLRPNMSARARIQSKKLEDVLRLPAQALIHRRGEYYVKEASADPSTSLIPVEVAAFDGDYYYLKDEKLQGLSLSLLGEEKG